MQKFQVEKKTQGEPVISDKSIVTASKEQHVAAEKRWVE